MHSPKSKLSLILDQTNNHIQCLINHDQKWCPIPSGHVPPVSDDGSFYKSSYVHQVTTKLVPQLSCRWPNYQRFMADSKKFYAPTVFYNLPSFLLWAKNKRIYLPLESDKISESQSHDQEFRVDYQSKNTESEIQLWIFRSDVISYGEQRLQSGRAYSDCEHVASNGFLNRTAHFHYGHVLA